MNHDMLNKAVKAAKTRDGRKRFIALLAVIAVFFTLNQLKFPADTLEHLPTCGYGEHEHDETCFDEMGNAVCGLEAHIHTDACFQERPKPTEEMDSVEYELASEDAEIVAADEIEPMAEELDVLELLTEDIPEESMISEGEAPVPEYTYDFNGASYACLSEVLNLSGTGLSVGEIETVGQSVLSDDEALSICVVSVEADYDIIPLRDFIDDDTVDLAVFTGDGGAWLIKLKNGVHSELAERFTDDSDRETTEAPETDISEIEEPESHGEASDAPVEATEETDEEVPAIQVEEPVDAGQDASVGETDDSVEEIEQELTDDSELTDTSENKVTGESEEMSVGDTEEAIPDTTTVEEEAVENAEDEAAEDTDASEEEDSELTEDGEEKPAEDEATEDADASEEEDLEPTEDGEEKPAEDEATEDADASEEEDSESTEEGEEKPAEDTDGSEEEDSEPIEDGEEKPVEDEAAEDADALEEEDSESTEDGEEKPAEDEAAEDTDASEEEDESMEDADEPEPDEASEDHGENGSAHAVISLNFDLSERIAPFSIVEMIGVIPPAEENEGGEAEAGMTADSDPIPEDEVVEIMDGDDNEGTIEEEAQVESRPWSLTWDGDILDILRDGDDYLIVPKVSFEATTVTVEAEDTYVLTLTNYGPEQSNDEEYPAQSFEYHADGMVVKAVADDGAFPANTTMSVTNVEDEDTLNGLAEAVEDEKTLVKRIHAVDITFRDENGSEIEPLLPICVSLSVEEIAEEQDALVLHLDDEGETQVVAQTDALALEAEEAAEEGTTVSFESDAFSVYALLVTETLEASYIDAQGETWCIRVDYDESARIPAGAQLYVSEIEQDSDAWRCYCAASAEAMGANRAIDFARYFDIEIRVEGEKIEPAAPVSVTINYADAVEVADEQELSIVHFADDGTEVIREVEVSADGKAISYEQASFSVTGTIVTNPTPGGMTTTPQLAQSQYALIAKYNGKYYIVMNDGTLEETQSYSEQNGTVDSVKIKQAMLWTYCKDDQGKTYIRHTTDSWNYGIGQLAVMDTGVLYEYINPTSDTGLSRDDGHKIITHYNNGEPDKWGFKNPDYPGYPNFDLESWELDIPENTAWPKKFTYNVPVNGMASVVYDNFHHLADFNAGWDAEAAQRLKCIGIEESDGELRIRGNVGAFDDNVGEFYFARPTKANRAVAYDHTVNHIDISVEATAWVNYPILPGTYNGVTVNEKTMVKLDKKVPVTVEDIKNGEVKAFTTYKGNIEYADDLFYITGFTGNAQTDISTPQVRIEGSFKVADCDPYNPSEIDYRLSSYWDGEKWDLKGENDIWESPYNPLKDNAKFREIESERLNKRVYYTVSTTKNVEFDVKLPGNDTVLFTVSIPVTLSQTFDYWDARNECPKVQSFGFKRAWQDGCIVDYDGDYYSSGMDFVLGGDADATAAEITKLVVDENGNTIKLGQKYTNKFVIYEKKTGEETDLTTANSVKDLNVGEYKNQVYGAYGEYFPVMDKELTIGENGMGVSYDYGFAPGLVYIAEDPASIPKEIWGADGNLWVYDTTHIETEYVRRWPKEWNRSEPNHFTRDFSAGDSGADAYKSMPEVIGKFRYDNNVEDESDVVDFFVYNAYKPKTYPVAIRKVDIANTATVLQGAEFDLYGPYAATDILKSGFDPKQADKKVNDAALTTGADGVVKIGDLTMGYYYLYETKAPSGYNSLTAPVVITVTPSNEKTGTSPVSYSQYIDGQATSLSGNGEGLEASSAQNGQCCVLTVGNTSGARLPSTGGLGTLPYTIGGLLLVALSALLLILRRKD